VSSERSEESLINTQIRCAMKRKSGCFAPPKTARRPNEFDVTACRPSSIFQFAIRDAIASCRSARSQKDERGHRFEAARSAMRKASSLSQRIKPSWSCGILQRAFP
jgi:hypothetical protein